MKMSSKTGTNLIAELTGIPEFTPYRFTNDHNFNDSVISRTEPPLAPTLRIPTMPSMLSQAMLSDTHTDRMQTAPVQPSSQMPSLNPPDTLQSEPIIYI